MIDPDLRQRRLDACPYKGFDSYATADAHLFFGREPDVRHIAGHVLGGSLTVLHGPSGVGKTSLLEAGLLPRLRQGPVPSIAISFRTWQSAGFLSALRRELIQALSFQHVDPRLSLDQMIGHGYPDDPEESRPVVLILDQFEEYFVYDHGDEGREFERQLARLVNRRDLDVHVLVIVREDALHSLERLQGRIPDVLANTLPLGRLSRETAAEAIQRPLGEVSKLDLGRFTADDDLVGALLDQVMAKHLELAGEGLAGGTTISDQIEAPYLQLALRELWEAEVEDGSTRLRKATLERLGGAETIARGHLDLVVQGLNDDDREICRRIFDRLVTPSGGKVALSAFDLARHAGDDVLSSAVEPLLRRLTEGRQRLLRPVTRQVGGAEKFEIFHDVLARPMLAWAERQAKELAERQKSMAQRRTARTLTALANLVGRAGYPGTAVLLALRALPRDAGDPWPQLPRAQAALRDGWRRSRRLSTILEGHGGGVRSVAFSPDGALLATAADDGKARLFKVEGGEPLAILEGHGGGVRSVAFSPDGALLATAADDARLWPVLGDVFELIRLARRDVGRSDLTPKERDRYGIEDDEDILAGA